MRPQSMAWGVAALAALILITAPSGTLQAAGKIRIGTDGGAPPWTFTDSASKLKGYDIDVGNEICKRLGMECEWIIHEWKGIFPALQAGKFDMIMAGMVATDERRKAMDFTRSYALRQSSFAVKKGSGIDSYKAGIDIINFDALGDKAQAELARMRTAFKGKTVGNQSGDVFGRMIEQHFAGTVDKREYDKLEGRDLDLQAERIDLAVSSTTYWRKVKKKGRIDVVLVGPLMAGGPLGGGIMAAVQKGKDKLRADVDGIINRMIKDDTLSKLAVKWLGSDASPKK